MSSAAFPKREHICSMRLIDELFGSGSQSMAAFPLRVVFRKTNRQQTGVPVQILISVPKKRFKHAVDRNHVKRQIREAYRLQKQNLYNTINPAESLLIGFIWTSGHLAPSGVIASRMEKILNRITEKL